MHSQHEIGFDEHVRWFDRVSNDPDRSLLIAEDACGPLGFVQFSGLTSGTACEWGFYVVPGAPKGTGRRLGHAALAHAFVVLDVSRVVGEALAYNQASIRFHEQLGFSRATVDGDGQSPNRLDQGSVTFFLNRDQWMMSQEKHSNE